LQPLEKKILSDFNLSKFIVCTDAGLSSVANRKFNNQSERSFITTQSIKKLKKYLREWALDPSGWMISGEDNISNAKRNKTKYNISSILSYHTRKESDTNETGDNE
jgi:hypothetical protein